MKRFPIILFLLLAARSLAQDAIGPFISTVGTTARDNNGRDWAYILWTANSPKMLADRSHAIYSRAGDASAGGPFTRVAIISLQSEAITLEPILRRAALIGDHTNILQMDIDALFGKLIPNSLSLPEKLSAVVRGGMREEKHFGRMVLLSRTHPSVAMALGFGHAELIPAGQTTFEVREFDRTTQTDGAVIGRVTVTAGAPTVLPAPGPPVELKHENARGHLNAQLRWGTPDELRRLSLLQHGYNVWRVRKDYADARNWGTTPPGAQALVTAASTAVKRVNTLPLLTSKTLSLPDASNLLTDSTTSFVADDNDRGSSNIISTLDFTNGARFFYFVTARDILGRDGMVSKGTEVQICNKLPPNALANVQVENDSVFINNAHRQRLRVKWPQALNLPGAEQQIKSYWVYRWKSVTELRLSQANPTNNLIAKINHTPGQAENTYLDNGVGAPTPPNDLGKTFYYTVRAEDDGACAGNLSPHSAPVFGVLRDREGPAAPIGEIITKCFDPVISQVTLITNGSAASGPLDSTYQFTAMGVRRHPRIAWMQFAAFVRPMGQTNAVQAFFSKRLQFGSDALGTFLQYPFDVSGEYRTHEVVVIALAGFADGEFGSRTEIYPISTKLLPGDQRVNFLFAADIAEQPKNEACNDHFTLGPAEQLQPLEITIKPAAGSKEVRLYRRVDDGPLDLIYQKPLTSLDEIEIPDDALPHGGGKVCYFACTLDEHGNSSLFFPLGCKSVQESTPPPRPTLSPIASLPPESAPQMILTWFCPSVNVQRFEVGIATFGDPIDTNCAPGYLQYLPPGPNPPMEPLTSQIVAQGGFPPLNLALEFRKFLTPRPGPDFGENDRFVVPVDIKLGRRYLVYVKSIAVSGARSERSNIEAFFWQDIPPQFPNVPWPARPLPPVQNSFGFNFDVSFGPWFCGQTNPPGAPVVRISAKGNSPRTDSCPPPLIGDNRGVDPNTLLPTNDYDEALFPVVLFRQQVTNSNFPVVSGDLTQVSPMMESIAWTKQDADSFVVDPFVHVQPDRGRTAGGEPIEQGMFLRDTQPIVSGYRYRYYLVRFNKLGEIAEVIPAANELEVP